MESYSSSSLSLLWKYIRRNSAFTLTQRQSYLFLQYDNGAEDITNVMNTILMKTSPSWCFRDKKKINESEKALACHLRPVKRKGHG